MQNAHAYSPHTHKRSFLLLLSCLIHLLISRAKFHTPVYRACAEGGIFSDWECIFYYDNTVPRAFIRQLQDEYSVTLIDVHTLAPLKLDASEVREMGGEGKEAFTVNVSSMGGMYWRFLAAHDNPIVLISDIDSLLTSREFSAVEEWLEGRDEDPKKFLVLRDHMHHCRFPMLVGGGGGWSRFVLPQANLITCMFEGTPHDRY